MKEERKDGRTERRRKGKLEERKTGKKERQEGGNHGRIGMTKEGRRDWDDAFSFSVFNVVILVASVGWLVFSSCLMVDGPPLMLKRIT